MLLGNFSGINSGKVWNRYLRKIKKSSLSSNTARAQDAIWRPRCCKASRHMANMTFPAQVAIWQPGCCKAGSPCGDWDVTSPGRHMATETLQARVTIWRPRRYQPGSPYGNQNAAPINAAPRLPYVDPILFSSVSQSKCLSFRTNRSVRWYLTEKTSNTDLVRHTAHRSPNAPPKLPYGDPFLFSFDSRSKCLSSRVGTEIRTVDFCLN